MSQSGDDAQPSPEEDKLLAAFAAGILSEEEFARLERLLEQSPRLRERLDRESGFLQISDVLPELKTPPPTPSVPLQKTLEILLASTNQTDVDERNKVKTQRLTHLLTQTHSGITLRHRIGRGGMGEVFEGYDPQLDRAVAVKVLPPNLLDDPIAHERLFREAQAAAQLHHENIVAVHSIQQINNQWCLVQQLVPGESLQMRLDRDRRLPWEELKKLALNLASGLAAAHRRKIIHRDLKPSNILMDSEANIARIADFGLAKRLTDQGLTTEGSVAGTPCFMSPEQAQAQELTPQSDLFSLGSVLYVAASGVLPFSGDNAYVILDQIRNKTPVPLSELRSDIPSWFSDLVARLMEKDVTDRINSAETIVEAIQNQHLPGFQNAGHAGRHLKPRMIVATIASLAVTLAAYGGWMLTRPPAIDVEANHSQASTTDSATRNAVTQAPFYISDLNQSFDNFNEAVAAAVHGSTVVIQSDGPFLVESIDLGNKKLSLIAAADRRPEFRPEKSAEDSLDAFIKTRAELHLQGLVIDWPIEAETKMDVIGQAIIIMDGPKLSLADCTLKSGKGASCIQMTSGVVELVNTHLIAASGSCIGARYGALDLHGTNVLFEGRNAIMLVNSLVTPSGSVTSEISLEKASVRAERFLSVVTPRPPRERLAVRLKGIVLDCSSIVVVVGAANAVRDGSQVNNLGENFAALVSWSDRDSIYNRHASYISFAIWRAPLQTLSGNISDLASWKTLFNDEMGGSITAEISTSSPTTPGQPLHQFTELSGTVPEPCGVDTSKLRRVR